MFSVPFLPFLKEHFKFITWNNIKLNPDILNIKETKDRRCSLDMRLVTMLLILFILVSKKRHFISSQRQTAEKQERS